MAGIKISIADLRPTQLTLGKSEVTQRAAKILELSADDRKAYPGTVQSRSGLTH
ncbi:MAG: ParB-like protein [Methylocystis sp.]